MQRLSSEAPARTRRVIDEYRRDIYIYILRVAGIWTGGEGAAGGVCGGWGGKGKVKRSRRGVCEGPQSQKCRQMSQVTTTGATMTLVPSGETTAERPRRLTVVVLMVEESRDVRREHPPETQHRPRAIPPPRRSPRQRQRRRGASGSPRLRTPCPRAGASPRCLPKTSDLAGAPP